MLVKSDLRLVNFKKDEDYDLDEKLRSVTLTEAGIHKVETILQIENIYSPEGFRYLHYLEEIGLTTNLYKEAKGTGRKSGYGWRRD